MALDTIKQGGTTAPEGSVKATMKLGIGSQEKTGVTKANFLSWKQTIQQL